MALDEPKDADELFDIDGFKYIVDRDFIEKAKPIKVDFQEVGFKLTSSLKSDASCGGCGTTDTCGH
ncbi:MAG: hypothetical protein A2V65_07610 [Deltaproteobacteria bacterium RBG_13_49_15]|nr:MAG: hypothetical protein A2V65_07610 [Deltaproteobacteria bacterium RBG_13_49_15]